MSNFEIVHYTSANNIEEILFSRKILNNVSVKKLHSHKITKGEGGFNRVLCEPNVYENEYKHSTAHCEEAFGIFCRIKNITRPFIPSKSRNFNENVKLPIRGKVAIIFHSYILNDYTWHFNYCENNGFYVTKTVDGFKAPFGVGECYANSTNDMNEIERAVQNDLIQNYPDTELVIHEDIHLYYGNYVKDIIDHTGKSILYKYIIHRKHNSIYKSTRSNRSSKSKSKYRRLSRSRKSI
jgi:hypothetical protein